MKSIKLSTKISILTAAAIVVASSAVGIVASGITGDKVKNMIMENLETTEMGVMDTLDNWRLLLEGSTLVLADKTRLVTALDAKDFDAANELAVAQKEILDIDYLLVTDDTGRIVGGNGELGMNLSSSLAVKKALGGTESYSYESTSLYEYSLVLGYPCWWGTMPQAVFTFLETADFSGKKILPFCTHGGSGMGRSERDIKKLCPNAEVVRGLAISGSSCGSAESTLKKWLSSNGL